MANSVKKSAKAAVAAQNLTPRTALGGAKFKGFVSVTEAAALGMISLRAKSDVAGLTLAIKAAVGVELPTSGQILTQAGKAAAWMSPDEYLLIMPYAEVTGCLAQLRANLAGQHSLAVDVSDARAVFDVTGPKADQALSKLCPVDFAALGPNQLRRTRTAQVAAAIWREGTGLRLVCFRSVAGYVMGLLTHSGQSGAEIR
jgi:sarcosine oxidase subunit gamma